MLGDLFIDSDAIITKNISEMPFYKADKLYAFGYPSINTIHLAVLSENKKTNLLQPNLWK
jgi:hypothetical protein